jgi:hypothetical protein
MPNTVKRTCGANAKFEGTSALYARFVLKSVQTHLRYLAHHADTDRTLARLILSQAHLDEAIGILATILPEANVADTEILNVPSMEVATPRPLMRPWS